MKARICREFEFDAAHRIPNHLGVCQRVHGHRWRVQVVLYGEVGASPTDHPNPIEGMVVDFSALKTVWARLEPLLDHQYLNESIPNFYPTAENLASFILRFFASILDNDRYQVESVRVYETPNSYAEVRGEDLREPRPEVPYVCPVCRGRQQIESGMYDGTAPVMIHCLPCDGTGVLWR